MASHEHGPLERLRFGRFGYQSLANTGTFVKGKI